MPMREKLLIKEYNMIKFNPTLSVFCKMQNNQAQNQPKSVNMMFGDGYSVEEWMARTDGQRRVDEIQRELDKEGAEQIASGKERQKVVIGKYANEWKKKMIDGEWYWVKGDR